MRSLLSRMNLRVLSRYCQIGGLGLGFHRRLLPVKNMRGRTSSHAWAPPSRTHWPPCQKQSPALNQAAPSMSQSFLLLGAPSVPNLPRLRPKGCFGIGAFGASPSARTAPHRISATDVARIVFHLMLLLPVHRDVLAILLQLDRYGNGGFEATERKKRQAATTRSLALAVPPANSVRLSDKGLAPIAVEPHRPYDPATGAGKTFAHLPDRGRIIAKAYGERWQAFGLSRPGGPVERNIS